MTPPMREVASTYLVTLTIFPIIFAVFALELSDSFNSNLFVYGPLLEFLLVGFVPILFALRNHDKAELYGLTRNGLGTSLALGLGLVALRAGLRYVFGASPFELGLKELTQSLAQPFPSNVGLALFTAFAYGPVEMFYILFLVVKLDQAFPLTAPRILSRGSLGGVALWSLIHLANIFFFGIVGAALQVVTNFVTGLVLVSIFKFSKCSLGPITYFTTANLAQ